MKPGLKTYVKLFTSTFYLSAFTFGGGFVIIPLMKKKYVDQLGWIEDEEMLNLVAIAQSSPGAIAVNASILIGYRIAGLPGAFITIFGTVLPPFIVLSIISVFYAAFRDNATVNAVLKGMQAGVAAIILDVVINMGHGIVKEKRIVPVFMMIFAFIAAFIFKINIMYIFFTCAFIGVISTYCYKKTKNTIIE